MDRDIGRRPFLVAAGAAASVAGCTGRIGETTGITGDDEAGGETTDDPDPTAGNPDLVVDDGELIEDFEDLSSWGSIVGEFSPDDDDWISGSQSIRVASNEDDNVAGVFTAFPDGLDLENRHLSMAVKVKTAGAARIGAEIHAPARSDHLSGVRYVIGDFDDWIRIDIGYTQRRGEPELSNVQEIRLSGVGLNDSPIQFWVDDLRATPAPDQGKAVLVFDGLVESHYDTVFPILEDRDMVGVVPTGTQYLNASGRLDVGQLREMRDAGWDIASRPDVNEPLPEMTPGAQRDAIESNHEYLTQRGFPDGSRHFFAPGYRMNTDTIEILRDVHETGFTYGACPNAAPPAGRYAASRFDGDDFDEAWRLLNLSGDYHQCVVMGFSEIGDDGFEEDEFESLLDHIGRRGMEVVSISQLIDD